MKYVSTPYLDVLDPLANSNDNTGNNKMYFWIRESWQLENTIIGTPELKNDEINFLLGTPITEIFERPIIYETSYEAGNQPHHYFDYGTCIPAVSKSFINALIKSGIDNFQAFPAILRNTEKKVEWPDYFALNVIGMVNATDLNNSLYNEIMPGNDDGGMPPLGSFTAIALHAEKLYGLDMFREPIGGNLIMSERALDMVCKNGPEESLGIIADEVVLT